MAESIFRIVTQVNELGVRVQKAILADEFVKARKLALMMLTAIAAIPDGEKQGEAGAKLECDRASIQMLIRQIAELEGQTRSLGIGISSLNYSHITGQNENGCCRNRRSNREQLYPDPSGFDGEQCC